MFIDLIQKNKNFDEIYEHFRKPGELIHGLTNSAKSLILAAILERSTNPILFVVQNLHEAQTYYREIKNLCPNKAVYYFQAQEVSPYDQINSDTGVLSSQYEIFQSWQKSEVSCTVLTIKAFSQLYISKANLKDYSFDINLKLEIDTLEMSRKLSQLGYNRQAMIENRGDFSLRGDILDIFPILGDPVRVEFFGDQVESIRVINITTQRSIKKIESITVHPRFNLIRESHDGLYEKILEKFPNALLNNEDMSNAEALYWEGIEYYGEFLDNQLSSIFDFIPSHASFYLDEWRDLLNSAKDWDKKQDELYNDGLEKNKLIPLQNSLHYSFDKIRDSVAGFKNKSYIQSLAESVDGVGDISYEITSFPTERFASKVEDFVAYIKSKLAEKQFVVVFSEQPQRVLGIMKEWDIASAYFSQETETFNLEQILSGKETRVIIQRDGLEEGCQIPSLNLTILTDRELFGRSRQAVAKQKIDKASGLKENRNIYTDVAELKVGDYVVHYKHGVGRYQGTEFVELHSGRFRQEYLAVEYADEARILIPVDQINLLSKFSVNVDAKPKLSKLGGTDWERTKNKVKKSVKRIAQDLINLYAMRDKQKGYKYPADTPWQIEIEDAFPYTETVDQLKAINEMKSDMEADKLMDRLICGDAGFGKTEVVLRIVFKVIMEGKQVAILVPTTVLAQQHFDVFTDRFAPYPIRIGLLSRFRTASQQKDVAQKLKLGEIDLVIGTHRLLQKDIQFKDLGLLVIDEEQRFGVAHKEKLKSMRKDLDVISMSATPIPRTLHMSLSGIRDISLISTPPTNRKPVKTYVGEFKGSLVRNAILHELERGGKVFVVHNRVENIESFTFQIQEMVPEADVRYAHGQMKDRELEDVMFSFVNNEFNVLVSTTIIETGIDISDANTIIINNANNFGLSQLYQLRGRVGRSDQQAYAYLLYSPSSEMSETARERLKAIRELTNLGAGYQISMRDMEIRGVGNVFGAEQHGHMLSVGFDLYCKMLSDTIEQMKGNLQEEDLDFNTTIDIKVNAYFPETWISDQKQRMNEYKRLSNTSNEPGLDMLLNEWEDRFGKIPSPAVNLVEIARLKIYATQAKVSSINQDGEFIRITNNLRLNIWLQVQRKLEPFIQSRLNFKAGAVGARTSNSFLNFKTTGMETEAIIQALKDICKLIA
jgi:transcription-repair coupling factor (superfamily II helicase)